MGCLNRGQGGAGAGRFDIEQRAEKEGVVFDDGSTEGSAKFVAAKNRDVGLEDRSGAEVVVGVVLGQGTVKVVRTGFRKGLDEGSAEAAFVGGEIGGLHFDCFHGVGFRAYVSGSSARGDDDAGAVELAVIVLLTLTGGVDVQLEFGAEAICAESGSASIGSAVAGDAGREEGQAGVHVAAEDGSGFDGAAFDFRSCFAFAGFDCGDTSGDFDGLLLRTETERGNNGLDLVRLKPNSVLDPSDKSGGLNIDAVGSLSESGYAERSAGITNGVILDAGLFVDDGDLGLRDRAAGLVVDRAFDSAAELRVGEQGQDEQRG